MGVLLELVRRAGSPTAMNRTIWQRAKRYCVERPRLKFRLKRWRYAGIRSLATLAGPALDPRPRVLGYHTVGDGRNDLSVSVDQFQQHLEWLLRHRFHLMTLRDWGQTVRAGGAVPPRTVVLSFDDGFLGVWRHAAQILSAHGLAGTVFIVTGYVGKTNAFDRPFLGGPELPLMGWSKLEALQRLGWDVQSHGRRHYPAFGLHPDVLDEEFQGSRRLLAQRLEASPDFFCYPYGTFDHPAVAAAARAGYRGALTCWSGPLPQGVLKGDWYRMRRSIVDGHMTLADFAAIFRRGYLRVNAVEFTLRRRFGQDTECPFDELDRFEGAQLRDCPGANGRHATP